eukprot:NODE_1421_length_1511_cov_63.497110_g1346_i0.p1 GENE.NODE_1421_length_1511_cov_63.497110_g1346_i0~~NODE_1421_length_1511_cov_63.497110_g1346_i0.p1  ORF type:complete len:458 (+),score=101.28 NODE_1421_length_1511_cov_63.497110_g1346_i0:51-1376(+)
MSGLLRRLYKNVPAHHFVKVVTRATDFLTTRSQLEKLNREYPPRPHAHMVSPFVRRQTEKSTGDRIEAKWLPKPYEMAWNPINDKPRPKNFRQVMRDTDGGIRKIRYVGMAAPFAVSKGGYAFPFPDYEFPRHMGHLIMKWLYQNGKESACLQRTRSAFNGDYPMTYDFSWTADKVTLIGDVQLINECGIFDNCIIKGDRNRVVIGRRSFVLEGTTISTSPPTPGEHPLLGQARIGIRTLIGPNCILDSCRIGNQVQVGANSTIEYGAYVSHCSIIAAGSLVEADQFIPSDELWGGRPARFIRELSDVDIYNTRAQVDALFAHVKDYYRQTTLVPNEWTIYEQSCDDLEAELNDHLKTKDFTQLFKEKEWQAKDLGLPGTLVEVLKEGADPEDLPVPHPTFCEALRSRFIGEFVENRVSEQAPVFTGHNHQIAPASKMHPN